MAKYEIDLNKTYTFPDGELSYLIEITSYVKTKEMLIPD